MFVEPVCDRGHKQNSTQLADYGPGHGRKVQTVPIAESCSIQNFYTCCNAAFFEHIITDDAGAGRSLGRRLVPGSWNWNRENPASTSRPTGLRYQHLRNTGFLPRTQTAAADPTESAELLQPLPSPPIGTKYVQGNEPRDRSGPRRVPGCQ